MSEHKTDSQWPKHLTVLVPLLDKILACSLDKMAYLMSLFVYSVLRDKL